jgi:hypothetical protein
VIGPLIRRRDWEARLGSYFQSRSDSPFHYGVHDCCLFVCGAILAMTGIDVAAPFRGAYRSRKEAMQLLCNYAGDSSVQAIVEKVTREYQMPRVDTVMAQRGDVVLIKRPNDYSLGIVDLQGKVAVAIDTGFTRIPISFAARAWHV